MDQKKYQLVLSRPNYAELLSEEFAASFQLVGKVVDIAATAFPEKATLPPLNEAIFARQYLPLAVRVDSDDAKEVVDAILKKIQVMVNRPNRQTGRWTLHAFALDHDPATQRATKIEKALMAQVKAKLPRFFDRYLSPEVFATEGHEPVDILLQIYVSSLDELWFSSASFASGVSPFIGGNQRMRQKAGAPSRSASKLDEAFVLLGRVPKARETAVDLGAAPGGWTFTLARHGADVTAVDHAELALPLGKKLAGEVVHLKENGLKYRPTETVDWLCCDMVIASRETLRMLRQWLENGWMRHFVVNVKLPQAKPWPVIKEALDLVKGSGFELVKVKHLYHDRQEITLMGSLVAEATEGEG